MKSDCCGAKVKWETDIYNTYTQADSYGEGWVCSKCHKPCKPKKEGRDE